MGVYGKGEVRDKGGEGREGREGYEGGGEGQIKLGDRHSTSVSSYRSFAAHVAKNCTLRELQTIEPPNRFGKM